MSSNVPAPILRVSRYGLIHSVGGEAGVTQFMSSNPSEGGPNRWEQGFDFVPDSCSGSGQAEDPCGTVTFTPAALPDGGAFTPYLVWESLKCSTIGNDIVGLQERTTRLLQRSTSRQVETELWLGTRSQAAGWSNPYLTDGNADVLNSGSATPFLHALALLQEELASCLDGSRGMIHATVGTVSKWFTFGAVYVEGGLLLDAFGNIVVPGVGYDGSEPDGESAPGTSEAWVFATDLINVRLSEIEVTDQENTRIDRDNNVDIVTATRIASAQWDCCQIAVLADLCSANCSPPS